MKTTKMGSKSFGRNLLQMGMVLLMLAFGEAVLFAQSEDDFEVKQLADNTLEITGYKGSAKDITIPSELFGLKVTRIGDHAFNRKAKITSVIIPDGVTEIGEGAFYYCNSLESIVFPDSLVAIGDAAFSGCVLTELTIPRFIKTIPAYGFNGNKIKSLTLPEGVTRIEAVAFEGNPITTLVIPASLAIQGIFCSFGDSLTRVTLPAKMDERNLKGSVPDAFYNFWISQNKAGGTYVKRGPIWTKE